MILIKCHLIFFIYFTLVHSFIIDVDDLYINSEFTPEELSEIKNMSIDIEDVEIEDDLLQYINTFSKVIYKFISVS